MNFNVIHAISDKAEKAKHTRFEHAIDDQLAVIDSIKADLDARTEALKNLSVTLDKMENKDILAILYPENHVKNKPARTMEI